MLHRHHDAVTTAASPTKIGMPVQKTTARERITRTWTSLSNPPKHRIDPPVQARYCTAQLGTRVLPSSRFGAFVATIHADARLEESLHSWQLQCCTKAIKYRIPRDPFTGYKFSSLSELLRFCHDTTVMAMKIGLWTLSNLDYRFDASPHLFLQAFQRFGHDASTRAPLTIVAINSLALHSLDPNHLPA